MNTWAVVWAEARCRHPLDYVLLLAMPCCVIVNFSYVWPGMVLMGHGDPWRGLSFMLFPVIEAFITMGIFALVAVDIAADNNSYGVPAFCITGYLLLENLLLRQPNPLFAPNSPLHANAVERVLFLCILLPGLFRRYGASLSSPV